MRQENAKEEPVCQDQQQDVWEQVPRMEDAQEGTHQGAGLSGLNQPKKRKKSNSEADECNERVEKEGRSEEALRQGQEGSSATTKRTWKAKKQTHTAVWQKNQKASKERGGHDEGNDAQENKQRSKSPEERQQARETDKMSANRKPRKRQGLED